MADQKHTPEHDREHVKTVCGQLRCDGITPGAVSWVNSDIWKLVAIIDRLEALVAAARAEAFAYGRCCDLYQDSLGQFHCQDCGQRTFAMLQAVQLVLRVGTEVTMNHEEVVRVALLRKTAPETITRLKAEKVELLEATQCLVKQFEKWEGYHQWEEEDETALERTRAAIAKTKITTNPEPEKG